LVGRSSAISLRKKLAKMVPDDALLCGVHVVQRVKVTRILL
jgi:hypothetical protein